MILSVEMYKYPLKTSSRTLFSIFTVVSQPRTISSASPLMFLAASRLILL